MNGVNEFEQIHQLCTSPDKNNWELGRALIEHVDKDDFAQYVVDCFVDGKLCTVEKKSTKRFSLNLDEADNITLYFYNIILFDFMYVEKIYIEAGDIFSDYSRSWSSFVHNVRCISELELVSYWGVRYVDTKNRLLLLKNLKTIVLDLIKNPTIRIDYAYICNLLSK